MSKIYDVKQFRHKKFLNKELANRFGCYKWWAKEQEFILLCLLLDIDPNEIVNDIERRDGLYCIYVGKTYRELRKRIANHLNGGLRNSTLRRTLSSLFEETGIDCFMNNLYIEFVFVKNEDKITRNKAIDLKEYELINSNLRILNIQDNHYQHKLTKTIVSKLKAMRIENK